MNIIITAKNYNVSEKLKELITNKVEKLEKFFGDDAEVKVVCRKENDLYKLELTIKDKGLLFRSEVDSDNMYQNIDLALPKVERQIIKYSDKLRDRFRKNAVLGNWLYHDEEDEDIRRPKKQGVSKVKRFDIVPLSVDEAQMYLDNSDHEFYVYLNEETGKVNIMYKRSAGDFGIIEPEY